MAQRPTSMSVLGWILIVFGILGFLFSAMMAALMNNPLIQQTMAANPLSPLVMVVISLLGSTITLFCGISCLKRWGWVRYLYAAWTVASLLLNFFTTPYSKLLMLPSVVIFAVVIWFLFAPEARAYFAKRDAATPVI